VPVATAVGLSDHYAYLEESLGVFPSGAGQERLAREAGFDQAVHHPLAGGLMGCLTLVAPR